MALFSLKPDRVQGLIFDGAIVMVNVFWLGSILNRPIEAFSDRALGLFLAAGVLTQFLGVLLKKGPLQERLDQREHPISPDGESVFGCLLFAHFLFFLIAAGMALALLGLVDLDGSGGDGEFLWFLLSMTAAVATTGATWVAIAGKVRSDRVKSWWPYQEVAGNILLGISAAILTRFLWQALLFEAEPLSYIGFNGRAFVLVLAASALFLVFYVPARLLFLVEDYRYPGTWLRLWLVAMLPLIAIVFFDLG